MIRAAEDDHGYWRKLDECLRHGNQPRPGRDLASEIKCRSGSRITVCALGISVVLSARFVDKSSLRSFRHSGDFRANTFAFCVINYFSMTRPYVNSIWGRRQWFQYSSKQTADTLSREYSTSTFVEKLRLYTEKNMAVTIELVNNAVRINPKIDSVAVLLTNIRTNIRTTHGILISIILHRENIIVVFFFFFI